MGAVFIGGNVLISNTANLIEGKVKVKCFKPDTYDVQIQKADGQWHSLPSLSKQGAELLLATAPFRSRTNTRLFCTENRKCLNAKLKLCLTNY